MNHKRLLSLTAAALLAVQLPLQVVAGDYYLEDGDVTITATQDKQTVQQGGKDYDDLTPVITQRNPETVTQNTVTITASEGATANVTLGG